MAEGVRVCAVVLVCFLIEVIFCGDVAKVTDLYCKDPDDGSFHRVNSSWSSNTFCGNYTCLIRRKKLAAPLRDNINLNPIDMFESDQANAGSEHKPYSVLHSKRDHADKYEKVDQKVQLDKLIKSISDKEDRYLNEDEIKTITNMLHTIKKSDLETIVEIYTLAKDILKEIDKDDTMNNEITAKFDSKCKGGVRNKIAMADVPALRGAFMYEPSDERKDASIPKAAVSTPFTGILRDHIQQDVPLLPPSAKMPYYYPMSGFQRSHSYIHHQRRPQHKTSLPRMYPPIKKEMNSSNDFIPSAVPNPYYSKEAEITQVMPIIPQAFLPIQQTNMFRQFNPYYHNWQMYHNHNYNQPPQKPLVQTIEIPKNLLSLIFGNLGIGNDEPEAKSETKPEIDPTKEKLLSVVNQKGDNEKMPPWKTKELSEKVINEVKANILAQKRQSLLPFRKMSRLEKVGKAIKLEDLDRKKRHIPDEVRSANHLEDEYEVYIEKITCPSFYETGYFQIGDLKKPFPSCCPRKLEKNLDTAPVKAWSSFAELPSYDSKSAGSLITGRSSANRMLSKKESLKSKEAQ